MRFTVWTYVSLASLLLGLAFYVFVGLANGSGADVGVYSVTVILVGLGLVGALVSVADRPTQPEA